MQLKNQDNSTIIDKKEEVIEEEEMIEEMIEEKAEAEVEIDTKNTEKDQVQDQEATDLNDKFINFIKSQLLKILKQYYKKYFFININSNETLSKQALNTLIKVLLLILINHILVIFSLIEFKFFLKNPKCIELMFVHFLIFFYVVDPLMKLEFVEVLLYLLLQFEL